MFGLSSGHRARVLQATLLIVLLVSARTGFAAHQAQGRYATCARPSAS